MRETAAGPLLRLAPPPFAGVGGPPDLGVPDGPEGTPADPATLDDAALIDRIADGEAAALAVLYDRHAAVVFAFARRILRDREAAEDLLQEVFFRTWQRAGAYRPERGQFVTWLLSMTHNLAIDEVRKRRRRPQKTDGAAPELLLDGVADGGPPVEDEVWQGALRGTLVEALGGLPPAQRDAIALAYFGGLTQREIAATMGAPLGTIKTRLRLGLDKLRAELGEATAGAA